MKHSILITLLVLSLSACATSQQERAATRGAVVGAAAGAVIGADRGKPVEGAIIGGAIGAAAGAILNDGNTAQPQPAPRYHNNQTHRHTNQVSQSESEHYSRTSRHNDHDD